MHCVHTHGHVIFLCVCEPSDWIAALVCVCVGENSDWIAGVGTQRLDRCIDVCVLTHGQFEMCQPWY